MGALGTFAALAPESRAAMSKSEASRLPRAWLEYGSTDEALKAKWEFPKIRGPNIDPKIVGLLLQGPLQKGFRFKDTVK